MDSRAREIVRIGDGLFGKKGRLNSLWQELALQFYPERADFTSKRNEGEEFADHLFSSYPVLARRELGNMLSEFLRPDKWFGIHVGNEKLDKRDEERRFLEEMTAIQWRAMTDPAANLITAMNEHDHDVATFGNAVVRVDLNRLGNGLIYKCFHLRDCAWGENADGKVDHMHRMWLPTARQLKDQFGEKKLSKDTLKACEKDPEKIIPCRHVVMPARIYQYKSKGGKEFPFVSLYIECESENVLEEVPLKTFGYVVPRWQKVSGSQYASSMSTSIILPDGRTIQVVMRTLREAGEKYADPPMVAVTEAIRGDIALYAGGVTTADIEYDERLGEVLRPIAQDRGGYPIGADIAAALKEDIRQGFFLDKIQLPEVSRAMTATEVRRRIQEHIRASAPLAKPLQKESNAAICDETFNILMANGAFPLEEMPESLEDRELSYKFRSPLDELAEMNEADLYVDMRDRVLVPAMQLDPSVAEVVDLHESTRDALRSGGWKATWFKPKEAVEAAKQAQAEKAQADAMMQQMAQAGAVAEQGGKGIAALAAAGQQPGGKPTGRGA